MCSTAYKGVTIFVCWAHWSCRRYHWRPSHLQSSPHPPPSSLSHTQISSPASHECFQYPSYSSVSSPSLGSSQLFWSSSYYWDPVFCLSWIHCFKALQELWGVWFISMCTWIWCTPFCNKERRTCWVETEVQVQLKNLQMGLSSNVLLYSKNISNLKNLKVRLGKGKPVNNIKKLLLIILRSSSIQGKGVHCSEKWKYVCHLT